MLKRYENIAALRAHYVALGRPQLLYNKNVSWYGGETEEDTLRLSELGNTNLVPQAEELLSQLESGLETPRLMWDRSVAGAFCCVPDVLAGLPTPMRRQVHRMDEHAPISIFAIGSSSAGIDAKTLTQRGTVILALVLALTRVRPVELYLMDIGGGQKDGSGETILFAKINTNPLDLATACYVLTSAGFTRRLVYGLEERLNGNAGAWPSKYKLSNPEPYYKSILPRLTTDTKRSLIIDAARLGDELLTQPIQWINKQIKRFTEEEEEEVI